MESIHIELPDKGMYVPVPEESGQYFPLKTINIPDGKFLSRWQPLNNVRMVGDLGYVVST